MIDQTELLDTITNHYLTSDDFNGLDSRVIAEALKMPESEVEESIESLVRSGSVVVLTPDLQENPAIICLDPPGLDRQLEAMRARKDESWWSVWAYPSPAHLKSVVDPTAYAGRPFALRLALGEPHLRHQAFDLRVLEFYRNDPRYRISADDMGGSISLKEGHGMRKSDSVYLHTFGFCFDEHLNRAVAAFLSYLARLSTEHQQLWNVSALAGDWMLHPDYGRSALLGEYPEGFSSYEALTEVLAHINVMCEAAGWKPLFRRDFRGDTRPKYLGFLIRPTAHEFDAFVQTLDKVLSENINADFFPQAISRFTVNEGGVREKRGTIAMLEEWLTRSFRMHGETPIPTIIGVFRKIRKLRSPRAHGISEDEWDPSYGSRQRELMKEVLEAIDLLRAVLAIHPKAGKIRSVEALQGRPIYFH
jgi:hypothetical protein